MGAAGSRPLKLAGAAGALAVCGASGVLVAANPRPAAAPLHPAVHAAARPAPSLSIPASEACAGGASRAASLDAATLAAVAALRAATTAGERQAILAQLTPAERLDLLAASAGPAAGCAGAAPLPSIAPSVVNAPASTPHITSSYVS